MNDVLELNSSCSTERDPISINSQRGVRLPNKFLFKSKKKGKRNGSKLSKLHKKKFKSRIKGGSIVDTRRKFNTPHLMTAPSIPLSSSVSPNGEGRFEPKTIK